MSALAEECETPRVPDVLLRPETDDDFDAIDDVVKRAFGSAVEARLVRAIRPSEGYIPDSRS